MKIITINLSEPHIAALKTLQDLGLYPSRSEAIRTAIRDFLQKELGFSSKFQDLDSAIVAEKISSVQAEDKKAEISRILRKLREESRQIGSIANY